MALGKNDQKIHVVPSKGWVVVRQGNASGYVTPGGNLVPVAFDNNLWGHLNALECTPVATHEPTAPKIDIWPNPSAEGWRVRSNAPVNAAELFDGSGRLVWSAVDLNTTEWRIPDLPLSPGKYVLRLQTDEGVRVVTIIKG
jgi:hypothetical protein